MMYTAKKLPFAPVVGRRAKYPFKTMKVGESFTIPKDTVKHESLASYAYKRAAQLRRKFSVMVLSDGRIQVYRWK